ncbi:MAG: hypothetical protein ACLT98_14735 [Eggerthellaceae bacterium]
MVSPTSAFRLKPDCKLLRGRVITAPENRHRPAASHQARCGENDTINSTTSTAPAATIAPGAPRGRPCACRRLSRPPLTGCRRCGAPAPDGVGRS